MVAEVKCSKPTITNGTVAPDVATIEQGAAYTVACDEGYTIAGGATLTCQDTGDFDQTPTCEGSSVKKALFQPFSSWISKKIEQFTDNNRRNFKNKKIKRIYI